MNLQQILAPIGDVITWSFDNILVPMGNMPNVLISIGLFVGILFWLKLQKGYNEDAQQNGTLK